MTSGEPKGHEVLAQSDAKRRRDDMQRTTDHGQLTKASPLYIFKRFASNCFPGWVRIDSG